MKHQRARSSSWIAGIGTMSVALAALFSAGGAATSAQAAEVNVTVTDPVLTQDGVEITDGQTIGLYSIVRLDADWSVGAVSAGDSFTVELPSAFGRLAASVPFQLTGEDGVTPVADCTWTDGTPDYATCTFRNDYSRASGTIFFEMQALELQTEQAVTVVIGNTPVVLPQMSVDVVGWAVPVEPEKLGSARIDDQNRAYTDWVLSVPIGSTSVEVSDTLVQLAGDRPHELMRESMVLYEFTDVRGGEIFETPGSKLTYPFTLAGDSTTLNAAGYSGTIDFTSDLAFGGEVTGLNPDHAYQIGYSSASTDLVSVQGDTFSNSVVLNGKDLTTSVEARAIAGGGASTAGFMSVSLAKQLIDESGIVTGVDSYPVTLAFGNTMTSLSVPADGTAISGPRVPADTLITICEQLPTVTGVSWLPYTISGDGVIGSDADGCYSVQGSADVALTLTNTATPTLVPTGMFSVTKVVSGPAADSIPATTEFTVAYSVDSDPIIDGTMRVTADGVAVSGPELPVGTRVTLSEVALPTVDGVSWETPAFSGADITTDADGTASFVIGADRVIALTLTNTATRTVVPPVPVEPGAPTGGLASTGGQSPAGWALLAALAVLLGASTIFRGHVGRRVSDRSSCSATPRPS